MSEAGMWITTAVIYLVGYAFSLVGGHLASQNVVVTIPDPSRSSTEPSHHSTELLGFVETTIYTTSWLMGREVFIPVWLGLKVSGHWRARTLEEARPPFNRWLIGTGVSLAYGIIGAEFINNAKFGAWLYATGFPVILVAGTLLLVWRGKVLARRFPAKEKGDSGYF